MGRKVLYSLLIIAIAVIVLPIYYSEQSAPNVSAQLLIPPTPDMPVVNISQAQPQLNSLQNKQFVAPLSQEKLPAVDHLGKFIPTHAWILQVGIEDTAVKTRSLIHSLQAQGFPAYSAGADKSNDSKVVLVGPYLQHVEAEYNAREIEDRLHVRPQIVPFVVNEMRS